MAFDAFRAESQARPRRGRLTAALSIAFHGALLAAGIAYSFWHVDELTPPMVKVTFLSAAPPPPPPPPPAGGGGAARKKVVVKPKTPIKPTDIVQPRETPEVKPEVKETKSTTDSPGERGGVKGGVIGGQIGGTIGGTIGGQIGGIKRGVIGGQIGGTGPARNFMPPGATPPHTGAEPEFPPALRRAGAVYAVRIKYCVTSGGTVDSATLVKGADSLLDGNVLQAVKGWHFSPMLAGTMPIPWCTFALFNFKGE